MQSKIAAQRSTPPGVAGRTTLKPLAGKLFDDSGRCLTPNSTQKRGRYHHYYISPTRKSGPDPEKDWRLPAAEIERVVMSAALAMLRDQAQVVAAIQSAHLDPRATPAALQAAQAACQDLESTGPSGSKLAAIVERVNLRGDGLTLTLILDVDGQALRISKDLPMRMKRRGVELRMVVEGSAAPATYADPALVKAVSDAHRWFDLIVTGKAASVADIARQEKIDKRQASRLLYLAFLSPRIVEAIVNGTQPLDLTVTGLARTELDPDWDRQHQALGLI